MDLIDSLNQIAARAQKQTDHILTEEATKNALVMPMLNALGYNVFDPTEVIPEFTADHGVKKGEKVDYAVVHEGNPMILIECKSLGSPLHLKHASQLFRYFSVTEARFAILTNGIDYQIYTDIEAPNKMDDRPFFEFNLFRLDSAVAGQIKKFSKASFDLAHILSDASELKYKKQITKVIADELESPSEGFVRHFTTQLDAGRFTAAIREQFTPLVASAFRDFIKERVNERIQSALEGNGHALHVPADKDSIGEEAAPEDGIVTTGEEMEAFHVVRAILAKHVDPRRVIMRDTKSYCGVLLDDNNRKPLCRLHFNYSKKYIGVFDAERKEERIPLEAAHDIYLFEDTLVKTLALYA